MSQENLSTFCGLGHTRTFGVYNSVLGFVEMDVKDEEVESKGPEITFDTGIERPMSHRRIDFRRLMTMMDMGSEPYNRGEGWVVVEFDPNGLGETYPVEDSVIQQVRAFGSAWIETNGRGRVLKTGGGHG